MSTRKRNRAQLGLDELSPQKSETPLSSTKKRKLDTHGASTSRLDASKQTVRATLGSRNEKESADQEEIERDELAEGSEEADEQSDVVEERLGDIEAATRVEQREPPPKKKRGRPPKVKADSTPKTAKLPKPKAGTNASRNDSAVQSDWEVPSDDPTPKRSSRKPLASVERAKAQLRSRQSVPRTKTSSLKKDKGIANQAIRTQLIRPDLDGGDEIANPTGGLRSRRNDSREETETEEDKGDAMTPVTLSTGRRKPQFQEGSMPRSGVASARRKPGRPKSTVGSLNLSETVPRGILTPSKKPDGRSRKSVAFEEHGEIDLGFTDIPNTASSKKKSTANAVKPTIEDEDSAPEEASARDEDEEKCMICSSLTSTKKNPMILCATCNNGIHLVCSSLGKVPKGDWFCGKCQPDAEEKVPFPHLNNGNEKVTVVSNEHPNIEGFESHLRRMKRVLLDKLTGQIPQKLQGHEDEKQKVYQVVEQTILAGEGNSMLVIGSRGCGKSTLVESVISDLSSDHRDSFHVVRLNGFIQTDDKLALKEIWRQLGREMEVDDAVAGKTGNASDTLASLLALLSHPSEISQLKSGHTANSVVFILDEFDLFTTHSRQTLLYNLFDIAQARKAPIVVLGLTTRIDVVESLEKRVKSRFSHRYVHLSPPQSLPAFWSICKEGLLVEEEHLGTGRSDIAPCGQDEFLAFWETMVNDLYSNDAIFKHHLESLFYRTKSVPAFFTSCLLPLSSLVPSNLPLSGKSFTTNSLSLSPPDSKLQILQGLSELELALLIAAARLDVILDTDTCNFAMAYDEYETLTSRHKIQASSTGITVIGTSAKVWGRDVALGAWEKLAKYELLVSATIGGGGGAAGRMWRIDCGLEEIAGSVEGLSTIMTKWCREI